MKINCGLIPSTNADAVVVAFSEKLFRKILHPSSHKPGTCGVQIHYDIRSATGASTPKVMYDLKYNLLILQWSSALFVLGSIT